jgi:uncharacterized protein (DUF1778 family)
MADSTDRKWTSVRLSIPVHQRLERVQSKLGPGASMGDAVSILMDPATLRITLDPAQRKRWERAAAHAGMELAEFVTARVEAALQYGHDVTSMRILQAKMDRLAEGLGVDITPDPGPDIQP